MNDEAPVGLVAAAGKLPVRLAERLESSGRAVFVVVLEGIADEDYSGFDHDMFRLGELSRIFSSLAGKACKELVFAGKLQRPKLASMVPDKLASRVVVKLLAKGDDAALEMLANMAEEHGMSMLDKGAILDEERAREGLLAGPGVPDDAIACIDRGKEVLAAVGTYDIGQAVLLQGERVIALEAAEGTDAMLERSAPLIDPDLPPAVLVKMMKSRQHRHLDPPVIGAVTLGKAAESGVSIVAVEAGGVLIADPEATLPEATRLGISLVGISR